MRRELVCTEPAAPPRLEVRTREVPRPAAGAGARARAGADGGEPDRRQARIGLWPTAARPEKGQPPFHSCSATTLQGSSRRSARA